MMTWLASIPPSVVMMFSGIIVAVIGVYFSRKKTGADAAHKITQASMSIVNEYEKRMARLEQDGARSNQRERKLSERVTSLENNDIENQKWIKSLETMYEESQRNYKDLEKISQRNYKELEQKYKDLEEKYLKLKATVDHGSSPELRAKE